MFRKKLPEDAPTFWIATSDLPVTPANAFYQKVDRALQAMSFGDEVRALCVPYYETDASKGGQPGIDPEVYFKMLLIGFFENLASERAIAERCADSFSIRAFLHYGLTEATPHHSSFTVIRQRLAGEVYEGVFALVLRALKKHKLLRGKQLAIDTSVLEANAALRSLEHRLTGESYRAYIKKLAEAAGVDPTDERAVNRFDRKRPGRKTSNDEWVNPHDPDAKVGRDKKGATRMLYKPEHIVDLETGAIVDVDLKLGDEADGADLAARVLEAEARLNMALGADIEEPRTKLITADSLYFVVDELVRLHAVGIDTAIRDGVRNRKLEKLSPAEQEAVKRARKTARSTRGKKSLRRRGEFEERSFAHTLDCGGARRTTLRGRTNILKRYLIQALGTNLSLLLRHTTGIGTLKQTWAAAHDTFIASGTAVLARIRSAIVVQWTRLAAHPYLSPPVVAQRAVMHILFAQA